MPGLRGKSLADILSGKVSDIAEGYRKLAASSTPGRDYLAAAAGVMDDPSLDLFPMGGMVRTLAPGDVVKTLIGQVGKVKKVNPKAYEAMVEFAGSTRPVGYADLDHVGVGALDMPVENLQRWYETMGKVR